MRVGSGWSPRRVQDDAARPTRAGALGRDHRAAAAFDLGLRLRRCAPSPPSGGLEEIQGAEINRERLDPDLTRDQPHSVPFNMKAELKRAAAGGPDMQRTRFLAFGSFLILTKKVHS